MRYEARPTSDVAIGSESVGFGGYAQLFLVPDSVPQHDLSSLSSHLVPKRMYKGYVVISSCL